MAGIYPILRIGLYLKILASPIRSSSAVIFFLFVMAWILSLNTSSSYFLSKSGGSTISMMSSIRFCFTISSIIYDLSREGEALIYIKWQLHCWSTIISYPKSSNAVGKLGTETEHPNKDFTMMSWTWVQILLKEYPILVTLSFKVFSDIFDPPAKLLFDATLFLFMAKFVKWTNVFLIEWASKEYFSVLNLANPYLYTKA